MWIKYSFINQFFCCFGLHLVVCSGIIPGELKAHMWIKSWFAAGNNKSNVLARQAALALKRTVYIPIKTNNLNSFYSEITILNCPCIGALSKNPDKLIIALTFCGLIETWMKNSPVPGNSYTIFLYSIKTPLTLLPTVWWLNTMDSLSLFIYLL